MEPAAAERFCRLDMDREKGFLALQRDAANQRPMNKYERQGRSAGHTTLPDAVARELSQMPTEVIELGTRRRRLRGRR